MYAIRSYYGLVPLAYRSVLDRLPFPLEFHEAAPGIV